MRLVVLLVCAIIPAVAAAEPFELQGEWWRAPAEPGRHTTLVCSFDSAGSNDADFAREMPLSGGFGMAADVPGAHGLATQIAEMGGHLHFVGGSNFQPSHGTLRMTVRGEVWGDPEPRWLFDARGNDRIGILREPGVVSLVFCAGWRTDQFIARLDVPVGTVSADDWHTIVASWDRASGTGWIAFDGRGETGPMVFSPEQRSPMAIYLAGGFAGRRGGLNLPGLTIDDFVLYDVALPVLQSEATLPPEEAEFLPAAEAGARRSLYFLADLQRWGGWQCIYSWPTLLGSSAQGREYVTYDDYIDNDKGNGSPRTAINFLYAYEVLGDTRFLDVGMRTAEFLLAAQDARGFWVHGYTMTVNGIVPAAGDTMVKLQDLVQAHPMLYLGYVYRLTGDERYLDAIKRAGEWYLAAQNPNGSWSHHYDAQEGVGKNAIAEPGAGELNDSAMNSAIDIMAYCYHLSGDGRYVQAIKRAGDWLIEAQGDTVPLWADQYDPNNNPQWARAFEPPAWGVTATTLACQALREVYRFSGDERYLEAIRRAIAWMEANLPDGEMSTFIEPETGKPIAAWERQIYYLDNPEHVAYLQTVPIGSGYAETRPLLAPVQRILEGALGSKPAPPAVTVESALQSLPSLREGARSALDSQNEAGMWVVENVADFMGSIGRGFGAYSPRLLLILRYIEQARIALGEIEPVYRGAGDLQKAAYPGGDWYDLDWDQHVGAP
ncbi:MAG: pectate lyase [Armatimonadota bacterium]